MKARRRAAALLAPSLVVALAACGDPSPRPAPAVPRPAPVATGSAPIDQSFRAKPPPPSGDVEFVPPNIQEARLANGMRVLVTTRQELPIVAVELVIRRGADQAKPGLGAFMASLLTQGTRTMSSLAYAEAVKDIGASVSSTATEDATILVGRSLTSKLPRLLGLIADAARAPLFDPADVERERTSRLTSIAQQRDRPATVLSNTVLSVLYPKGHPYASPLIGEEPAVKSATRAELQRVYDAAVGPEDATLAFAGDVTLAEAKAQAERAFGDWKGRQRPFSAVAAPPPPDVARPRIVLVERPGATQSQVAVTLVGVPRKSPDFEAILVMNSILGAQFSSRLNMNLREKHAYTYGARSGFDMRLGAGPFTAGGAIEARHTAPAVKEILAEIDRMRREPVTPAELSTAQQYLVRQLPARFETARETASTSGALSLYDLPLDEFAGRAARIEKVSAADVQRVAARTLVDGGRFVVVVGPPEVREGLEALGLGEVEVRRAPAPSPAPAKTPAKR